MKLVVLAGAKKGATVPLKKDRFIIGRAKDCSLRAGSDAISRKHCEITRTDDGVLVRDLGSRNGTYVNDERIEGKVPLGDGDRLRVGPLEFSFEMEEKPKQKAKAPKSKKTAAGKPKAKGGFEDNISDWLIGDADPSQAALETQSFHVDETKAMVEELAKSTADSVDSAAEEAASEEDAAEEDGDESEGKKKKKKPGKLPKGLLDQNKTKDSREAAVKILRDMARRR